MIRGLKNIAIILFTIFVSTCDIDKCLQSAGEEVNHIIEIESFKVAEVYSMFNVELVQDTTFYLEVIAGENIVNNIETTLERDTLSLYNYNSCAWSKDYARPHVRIHFSDIETVNILESSYVYSSEPITDDFRLVIKARLAEADVILNSNYFFFLTYMSTGGRYSFSGKVDRLSFSGYYNALIDASELQAREAQVMNHSVVDQKVWAESKMNVEIYNVGNIFYKGNPEIIIDSIASSGNVFPLD
jgi:hypothetical protein